MASYQGGTDLITLFNKMNEVFARQFDHVISFSTLGEIERWKFYIECRFDHVDKKKLSLTDNKLMIQWRDGLMQLLHKNYAVVGTRNFGVYCFKHGRRFKINKYFLIWYQINSVPSVKSTEKTFFFVGPEAKIGSVGWPETNYFLRSP